MLEQHGLQVVAIHLVAWVQCERCVWGVAILLSVKLFNLDHLHAITLNAYSLRYLKVGPVGLRPEL